MPRVLFVAPSAYLLSGLASWLDILQPRLAVMGWEVVVGLVEGPRHHRPERYREVHPHDPWVAIRCSSSTPEGRRRAVLDAVARVQPDVVASVNVPDVCEVAGEIRKRSRKPVRVAMTVHGIEAWLVNDLRRYSAHVDAVVCTNQLACELARHMAHVSPARVFYASYGVSIPGGAGTGMRRTPFDVAWVGRLEHPQKRALDLPGIVDAVEAEGVQFRMRLIGDGPEEAGLRERMKRHLDAGRVVFEGRLDPEVVKSEVYPNAHCLLMTSSWETGPIVIWEAMARGVPVVTSAYIGSGLEGALRHDVNALVFPSGDIDCASRELLRLASDTQLRTRLARAGRQIVTERYSEDVSAARWDHVLKSILQLPSAPSAAFPPRPAPSRLDRWVGVKRAETVRAALRRTAVPAGDPGGEWPHSYSSLASGEIEEFWKNARLIDRAEPPSSEGPLPDGVVD